MGAEELQPILSIRRMPTSARRGKGRPANAEGSLRVAEKGLRFQEAFFPEQRLLLFVWSLEGEVRRTPGWLPSMPAGTGADPFREGGSEPRQEIWRTVSFLPLPLPLPSSLPSERRPSWLVGTLRRRNPGEERLSRPSRGRPARTCADFPPRKPRCHRGTTGGAGPAFHPQLGCFGRE